MAHIIAVSALNKYVKSLLENEEMLLDIAIRSEISNYNRHYKTGHCYFTLKDETASVKAVMFRSDADGLAFTPKNGMRVLARCRVSLYERDGTFQLYVQDLFPDGVGAAQMAFEQLKERLNAEGLFLQEYKKTLPAFPQHVGLVTSKTGAALQDILKIAARRCPMVNFLLAPVTVQGDFAAEEIARAIRMLDTSGRVDIIIVARGGGSAEDLWVFNSETIARAAFSCLTPIVSAIGHEVDFTILDFVADVRAPTPSAAAELALPDMQVAQREMYSLYMNISKNMQFRLDSWYNKLNGNLHHSALRGAALLPSVHKQKLQQLQKNMLLAQNIRMQKHQTQLQVYAKLAASLNPYAVLARGFSIVEFKGSTVRSVQRLNVEQQVNVRLQDGEIECTVTSIHPSEKEI